MRKMFLILGLVAITLLTGANEVFGQRGRVGWGVGSGLYGSPYYYGGRGYYPYYYGNDYPRGYYYSTPNYYYSEAPVTQLPATNYRQSSYSDPASATITVLVPNQDAQVWFDDTSTTQRGMERTFHTPGLKQAGTYTIKASWTDNGRRVDQERSVQVQAGQSVMVDFRFNPGETLIAPRPREKSESR
jgi:uncharacterized protein (TIGR03000 family)